MVVTLSVCRCYETGTYQKKSYNYLAEFKYALGSRSTVFLNEHFVLRTRIKFCPGICAKTPTDFMCVTEGRILPKISKYKAGPYKHNKDLMGVLGASVQFLR